MDLISVLEKISLLLFIVFGALGLFEQMKLAIFSFKIKKGETIKEVEWLIKSKKSTIYYTIFIIFGIINAILKWL